MKLLIGAIALFGCLFSSAQAALVRLPYALEVTSGSFGSVGVGDQILGEVEYDDAVLTGADITLSPSTGAEFTVFLDSFGGLGPFSGGDNERPGDTIFDFVEVTLDGAGNILSMDVSLDIPATLFIGINPNTGEFQVDINDAPALSGILVTDFSTTPSEVPVPGAAVFIVTGLLAGGLARHRRKAA